MNGNRLKQHHVHAVKERLIALIDRRKLEWGAYQVELMPDEEFCDGFRKGVEAAKDILKNSLRSPEIKALLEGDV